MSFAVSDDHLKSEADDSMTSLDNCLAHLEPCNRLSHDLVPLSFILDREYLLAQSGLRVSSKVDPQVRIELVSDSHCEASFGGIMLDSRCS
mmetsp:Transcript_3554/g.10715  ORF Transcript_3554/g.10715 Transcript_3554/m.10715 type:complete len:91 (+) Transcript_3554:561-833(+)